MSYQRAVVNCRRCYALANQIINANVKWMKGEMERDLVNNDQISQARNEAMNALEHEATTMIGTKAGEFYSESDLLRVKIGEALTACMNCDYKKARIDETFKSTDKDDGSV